VSLPYLLRLVCILLAVFALANAALSALVVLVSPLAIRLAGRMAPRSSATALLALRLLPAGASLFLVCLVCVPAYLRLEPERGGEWVGLPCLIAAVAGAGLWVTALAQTGKALTRLRAYLRGCRADCRVIALPGDPVTVWLLDNSAPHVALAGLLRPRLVISGSVVAALSPAELTATLRHERAHRNARDNWKRLLALLAPAALPGSAFRRLDHAWAKYAEWAADDAACAADAGAALSLASALVRVAKMRGEAATLSLAVPLLGPAGELSARVERLLKGELHDTPAQSRPRVWAVAAMLAAVSALMLQPAMLASAHRMMEMLID
jgi:Zn-dependent protease with chaperone function